MSTTSTSILRGGLAHSMREITLTGNLTLSAAVARNQTLRFSGTPAGTHTITIPVSPEDDGLCWNVTNELTGAGQYFYFQSPRGETPLIIPRGRERRVLWNGSEFELVGLSTRGCVLLLCAGHTPTEGGDDLAEVMVPYDPTDGETSITWNIRRTWWRVATAGSNTGLVNIQKSTVAGVFDPTVIGVGMQLVNGVYQVTATTALGTVASGNKLRFSIDTLCDAEGWTIGVELGD